MEKLKTLLQSLSPLTDQEFEESKKYFSEAQFAKGDYFAEAGKVSKHIAFVNRGSFRTYYYNQKGDEITACFRTENNLLSSYTSFILQEPSQLFITSLEESELILLDYDSLQELYSKILNWQIIGRITAEREYINMEQYASVLNTETAKQKYLRLQDEQPQVFLKSNLEHIASYLGVTRRTLSRIRQEISA